MTMVKINRISKKMCYRNYSMSNFVRAFFIRVKYFIQLHRDKNNFEPPQEVDDPCNT